ncbi:MAG: hypothetical protein AAF610_03895 [Pseudomonadota bacterium]
MVRSDVKPAVWVGIAILLSLLVGAFALRALDEPVTTPATSAPPVNLEPAREVVSAPAPEAIAPGVPTPVNAAASAPEPSDEDDGVRRIDLSGNPNFFALFEALGIDDVEGQLATWGLSRGYPQLDEQGNPILDQPYEQYDNATLKAFADGDDMWAQQFLGERLSKTDPEQALEYFQRAAVNGSVHAMTQMARLYRDLQYDPKAAAALSEIDGDAADGRLDVTGYAWAAVAERAGWDPLRGGMTAGFVGAKLSDAQRDRACAQAETLYASLVAQRNDRGLGAFPTEPPPVVFDPGAVTGTGCGEDATPRYQAQCQEVEVTVGGQVSRLWTCGESGS